MTDSYRLQETLDRITKEYEKIPWDDFPEPAPCSKCGRVIYCGVSKLCSDESCPKKQS